jgi:hypothetical protein
MADNINQLVGSFVPTSYVWDVARLYEIDVNSEEFKELLVRLYQNINAISLALNIKDTGMYNTSQFINGQIYFPNPALNSSTPTTPDFRQVYRLVINFGALPNTTTKTVPHGITITDQTTFTRIYATASDTTGNTFIPIPYASLTLVNVVEINVDATNVNITTGIDRTNYNVCYVVLEYLQE